LRPILPPPDTPSLHTMSDVCNECRACTLPLAPSNSTSCITRTATHTSQGNMYFTTGGWGAAGGVYRYVSTLQWWCQMPANHCGIRTIEHHRSPLAVRRSPLMVLHSLITAGAELRPYSLCAAFSYVSQLSVSQLSVSRLVTTAPSAPGPHVTVHIPSSQPTPCSP